jgi:hypothetical protein
MNEYYTFIENFPFLLFLILLVNFILIPITLLLFSFQIVKNSQLLFKITMAIYVIDKELKKIDPSYEEFKETFTYDPDD